MNNLLVQTAANLGMISKNIDLDVDSKIFECEKKDARPTYKKTLGYQPMMAFSGRIPLYIEGRNGNTNASFRMNLMLRDCFRKLQQAGVKVKNLRIDAAGCQYKVIKEVKNKCEFFFIRCVDAESHLQGQALKWEKVSVNDRIIEVAEALWYSPDYKKPFRLAVERTPNPTRQTNIFTSGSYIYRGIITDNRKLSTLDVIKFYNQRGAAERNFDFLGNDFNMNHMPFSEMKTNVVFMAAMSWCMTVFEYIKTTCTALFGKNVIKWRVKKLTYRYIIQPFKIVSHARRTTIRYLPGYA